MCACATFASKWFNMATALHQAMFPMVIFTMSRSRKLVALSHACLHPLTLQPDQFYGYERCTLMPFPFAWDTVRHGLSSWNEQEHWTAAHCLL